MATHHLRTLYSPAKNWRKVAVLTFSRKLSIATAERRGRQQCGEVVEEKSGSPMNTILTDQLFRYSIRARESGVMCHSAGM